MSKIPPLESLLWAKTLALESSVKMQTVTWDALKGITIPQAPSTSALEAPLKHPTPHGTHTLRYASSSCGYITYGLRIDTII